MTTGYETLDLILALILAASSIWYGYTIADELIKIFKKKTYWLTVYHEDSDTYELIDSYKERNMRNAVLNHLSSYKCDMTLLKFQTEMDYNELVMIYALNVDGETYYFTMLKEIEGVTFEQR